MEDDIGYLEIQTEGVYIVAFSFYRVSIRCVFFFIILTDDSQ